MSLGRTLADSIRQLLLLVHGRGTAKCAKWSVQKVWRRKAQAQPNKSGAFLEQKGDQEKGEADRCLWDRKVCKDKGKAKCYKTQQNVDGIGKEGAEISTKSEL